MFIIWNERARGIPQDSVWGLVLFNIFNGLDKEMDTDDTQLDGGVDILENRKKIILKGFILKTTGLQKKKKNNPNAKF